MVVGEILGYHGRTVASIRHGNVSGGRLLFEKLLQNAPLGGHVAIQRIVDQDSQIEFLADFLDSDVASQWSVLKEFFKQQPSTTYISVSYARNGTAMVAQDFTNDHELAANALRLPIGPGAFSSPYFTLLDLMKRLPSGPTERRSILLISSGIDYFNGNFPESPDLQSTYERAQKENINIWSIYYPDAGHLGSRGFRAFRGQNDLSRLGESSGAESYYLGVNEAVTFKPYLD